MSDTRKWTRGRLLRAWLAARALDLLGFALAMLVWALLRG